MNPTGVSWQHQLLLKLLNNYSQFLSLSYRKSETTHLRTRTFHRRHLEQHCFKRFARNMSCILTEELNTSYLTCFKGFTWVRQRMWRRSFRDVIQHLTLQLRKQAKKRPGFREEHSERMTVLLLLWWNGFAFLGSLPLYQPFQWPLSLPNRTNTAGSYVSLAALARPSPPYDPEKGELSGTSWMLWFVISKQAMQNNPWWQRAPLSLLLLITDIKPLWV